MGMQNPSATFYYMTHKECCQTNIEWSQY